MMMNILICTGILWVLSTLFVLPLTNYWTARRLEEPAYAYLKGVELTVEQQAEIQGLWNWNYVVADVLVLAIAGLVGGLFGYWFIGFSLEAKGWPGMVAFIGASLLAVNL